MPKNYSKKDKGLFSIMDQMVQNLESSGRLLWCRSPIGEIYVGRYKTPRGTYIGCGNVQIKEKYQEQGIMGQLLKFMDDTAEMLDLGGVIFYTVHSPILAEMLRRRGYASTGEGTWVRDVRR